LDITIAVNGAAKLNQPFDYFMCGDHKSSSYDWFKIQCSKTRVIAKLTAGLDEILYPPELFPDIKRMAVTAPKQGTIDLPCPVWPHMTFMYRWYKPQRLKKDMDYLMFGGTISCCAVQLAYVMGASKIVLFGCGFNNLRQHYFYRSNRRGSVSDSQRNTMNVVINELKKQGIQFQIIGETTLSC
jgi:hypothetical protein